MTNSSSTSITILIAESWGRTFFSLGVTFDVEGWPFHKVITTLYSILSLLLSHGCWDFCFLFCFFRGGGYKTNLEGENAPLPPMTLPLTDDWQRQQCTTVWQDFLRRKIINTFMYAPYTSIVGWNWILVKLYFFLMFYKLNLFHGCQLQKILIFYTLFKSYNKKCLKCFKNMKEDKQVYVWFSGSWDKLVSMP